MQKGLSTSIHCPKAPKADYAVQRTRQEQEADVSEVDQQAEDEETLHIQTLALQVSRLLTMNNFCQRPLDTHTVVSLQCEWSVSVPRGNGW